MAPLGTHSTTTPLANRAALPSHWYALVTRSRHERAVQRHLARLHDVETYLPLWRVWSTRVDRRIQIDAPVLPGYVFVRAVLWPDVRSDIKRAPGVVGFVGVDSAPATIPAEQIESLRIMLSGSADVHVCAAYELGQAVRIKRGPLAGACGVLIRANPGRHRLVVRIEHVGLALSADVHEADVEAIDVPRTTSRLRSERSLCYSRAR